ncbi:MAG: sensor histidine kinase [Calditrichaeota bacterium]|nr:HAMP domain-containing histidine kinase [Calditrichota bacterium]RQW02935.1 MAG: sensor histidine kinase [Calditrichota bacterium]
MNSSGYCIIDENFNVKSFNNQFLQMLSIENEISPEESIRNFLMQNEILTGLVDEVKKKESGETDAHLELNDSDSGTRNFNVHLLFSSYVHNHSFILITLYEACDQNFLDIHLDRSLKFNAISKLARSIRHEISNPLSSVAIHTEILGNTLKNVSMAPHVRERIEKSIQIINSEQERFTRLMDKFFQLAKANNRESSYQDVKIILEDVYDLIKQHFNEEGLNLEIDLENNIPFIHVNRDRLIEVLLNLVLNSVESMKKGATVVLKSRREGDRIQIMVHDTGKGISSDLKNNIFRRFFTTKTDGGGASLVLCKKILEDMGGTVSFSSNPDDGTTFTITLKQASNF